MGEASAAAPDEGSGNPARRHDDGGDRTAGGAHLCAWAAETTAPGPVRGTGGPGREQTDTQPVLRAGGWSHDVDAYRRPAGTPVRPVRDDAVTPAAPVPQATAAARAAAALRLRALQPAGRPADPARAGQAVQGQVPQPPRRRAAPIARGPAARRRAPGLLRAPGLAAAAGPLDRAGLPAVRLPPRPRRGHARLDRPDRVLPLHERPLQRPRHPRRARSDTGRARERHPRRLPHLLRARQGAAGDGHEDAGGRGPGAAPRRRARLAAGRGRRPRGQRGLRETRGAPLHPARHTGVEPREGPAPCENEARQLQRLAPGTRRRLRLLRLRRHRPRPPAELPRADARLLPRPRRRLRHRPAGVRQLRHLRHQGRRVAAVPLPRADPAGRQPLRRPHVRRHLQRGAHQGPEADRRAVRLDHRGHGHRLRDAPPPQPRHGQEVGFRLHPRRARRRRGPDRLDGLLHPAAALVARDVRDAAQAVLEGALHAVTGPPLQLHHDGHLLPDVRAELDTRRPQLHALPRARRLRRPDRPGRVDDALRQRLGAPDRPLRVEPPAQRLPARAGGLRRRGRHADVRALRADLRPLPLRRRAAPQEPVRGDPQGRLLQSRHPLRDLPGAPLLPPGLRRLADRLLLLRPCPPGDDHLGRAGAAGLLHADRRVALVPAPGRGPAPGRTARTAAARRDRRGHRDRRGGGGRPERRGGAAEDRTAQTMQIPVGGTNR